jgi:hypothetical protein
MEIRPNIAGGPGQRSSMRCKWPSAMPPSKVAKKLEQNVAPEEPETQAEKPVDAAPAQDAEKKTEEQTEEQTEKKTEEQTEEQTEKKTEEQTEEQLNEDTSMPPGLEELAGPAHAADKPETLPETKSNSVLEEGEVTSSDESEEEDCRKKQRVK